RLGIEATLGLGHSLGELTALHWAGAFDEEQLLRTAGVRGRAMAGAARGTMLAIGAERGEVESLFHGDAVAIACVNSRRQTIVSGEERAVVAVEARARARGMNTAKLSTLGAFHSQLMSVAVPALATHLAQEPLRPLRRRVVSTVTGGPLLPD